MSQLPGLGQLAQLARLAMRNLTRNKKRSISCILAVSIAALILSFMSSFIDSVTFDMQQDIIRYNTGEIFIENTKVELLKRISSNSLNVDRQEAEALLRAAEQNSVLPTIAYILPQINAWAEVFRSTGGVVDNPKTTSVSLKGRDFQREIPANHLDKLLLAGRFPETDRMEILISEDLAQELAVQLNDRVTFLTSSAHQAQVFATYMIAGIVRSQNSNLLLSAFMNIDDLAQFLDMPGRAHRVNLVFHRTLDIDKGKALLPKLQAMIGQAGNSDMVARFWYSDSPLYSTLEMGRAMMGVYNYFFFFLTGLVILNSAMMSLYERRHELGVLKALGTSNRDLQATLLLEQLGLSLLGSMLGIGVALLLVWLLNLTLGGLPLPATFQEQGIINLSILHLQPDFYSLWKIGLAALVSSCILTLYPIVKTSRKKVSKLLYHSFT